MGSHEPIKVHYTAGYAISEIDGVYLESEKFEDVEIRIVVPVWCSCNSNRKSNKESELRKTSIKLKRRKEIIRSTTLQSIVTNMSGSGLTSFMDQYQNFMDTRSDPRTSKWLLIGSPAPLLTILVTYLYFCAYAGPKYMKDRKPFDLKNWIILYNFVQVGMSIFLVYEGLQGGWLNSYSFTCQPVDWSDDPKALRMAAAVWWYFFCKISELLDTVFFVLRKKNNQISFLHLYHHTMMPICAWVGTRFLPGGHGTLLGMINSFIHIIMYSYYLVSSLGPQYQKYLWWKKHLTTMQMIQFCIIFVHNSQLLFRECNYPKFITFLLSTQALFFLVLFGNFYRRTYARKRGMVVGKSEKREQNGHVEEFSQHIMNGIIKNLSDNKKQI